MIQSIKNSKKTIDKTKIDTIIIEYLSAFTVEVEAGTSGYMGGDSGHGARAYVRLEDLGSMDIRANVIEGKLGDNGGVELIFGGDCELAIMPRIFRDIADILEEKRVNIIMKFEGK